MIGSAGGVCRQIVKQIIPVMSLFVQQEPYSSILAMLLDRHNSHQHQR